MHSDPTVLGWGQLIVFNWIQTRGLGSLDTERKTNARGL